MADPDDDKRLLPQQTDDLFGHKTAENSFLDAFNSDRIHHAWLIAGPKGIGKATFAWRCAKFLLAKGGGDNTGPDMLGDLPNHSSLDVDPAEPVIQRIKAGGHGGVVLLERTENPKTGKLRKDIVIDDVRNLIGFFGQTNTEGGWRVAIIDAVDEMNTNAANALLKLLEEPPAKSILLLVAHSPGRLLPTIRSRCRQLSLSPLDKEDITNLIRNKYPELPEEETTEVCNLAEGAPGKAISLIESNGLATIRKLDSLLSQVPNTDISQLHAISAELGGVKADQEYRLFVEMFQIRLQNIILHASGAASSETAQNETSLLLSRISTLSGVDNWLELWEKTRELITRADAVNLDRKQVIISLFSNLRALAASR
jgi:DNA polymerase-3 subunit delta'